MGSQTPRSLQKRGSPEPLGENLSPEKRRRLFADNNEKEENSTRDTSPQSSKPVPVPVPVQVEVAATATATAAAEVARTSTATATTTTTAYKPAECGVISKISCENFMCHRKFEIDLCRNVNFIFGQNGSGKSAILAAIQICLGAGARRTHRARNLKELVRKDCKSGVAKVRVTLLNQGVDAYRHELYGDRITIERTIVARGGGYNGYKLIDVHNKEVSRSKKDLDDLLDKVNAQVENPVAILDQEDAKKFLTGKAQDKYDFFMKATELERIDRTIATTEDKIFELEEQEKRMTNNIQDDYDILLKTKKQYEQHQEIEKLKRKMFGLEEALAWAFYQEANQTLQEELERIQVFREKATRKQQELTQEESASQNDAEEVQLRQAVDDLTEEADRQADLKRQAEVAYKKAKEPLKGLERQLKGYTREHAHGKEVVRDAKKRLQDKRDEILKRAGAQESEAAQRTQRLQQAEEDMEGLKTEYDAAKQTVTDSLREYEMIEPHVDQARANINDAERKVRAIENQLASLENNNAQGQSMAIFGQRVPQLKRLVDQTRFRGPVLGPIGSYLKIAPGKGAFAGLAELGLGGGVLDRFIVTTDQDRKTLQGLRQKVGCRNDCGIFQVTPTNGRHSVPPPPVEGIETIETVYTISNDLVFNCLVDNCKIEERGLSKSKQESENLLLTRNTKGENCIKGKIKNVFFLPKGDQWEVRNGNMSVMANERTLRQSIGVDQTAALQAAQREMEVARNELSVVRREEGRLEHQHREKQVAWNKAKKHLRDLQQKIELTTDTIVNIKDEEESAENFDSDTSDLQKEVERVQGELDEIKERESTLQADIESKSPEVEELRARIDEVDARNSRVSQELQAATNKLAMHVQSLTQKESKLQKKRERVEALQKIVGQQEEKISVMTTDANKYMRHAKILAYDRLKREEQSQEDFDAEHSQYSQEPTDEELNNIEVSNVDKESNYYRARVDKIRKKIDEEKTRRNANKEDPVEAFEKYQRAKDIYEGKKEQLEEIAHIKSKLSKDILQRKFRWRNFREHIAVTTSMKFDEVLNLKGSSGTVEYDHEDKSLDLIVQKDSGDANSQQSDVKALSGGERSFATIALLMALGESIETPFRIMDEFDVFMDPVSRKLTIEQLIETAKVYCHRQFIFITPQDVSGVNTDSMVKIHKMTPPARVTMAGGASQQTIDFSQSQS